MAHKTPDEQGERYLLISSDCHAGAQPGTYRTYLDAPYRDAYDSWLEAFNPTVIGFGGTLVSGEGAARRAERDATEAARQGGLHGAWDPSLRERELDREGLAGEVIFPDASLGNHVPFGAGLAAPRVAVTGAQVRAGAIAHNRWLADFCSHQPERHLGAAVLAVHDPSNAVQDVMTAYDLGLRAVTVPPLSLMLDDPSSFWHDLRYDALWAACEERGMPLHTHAGGSPPNYGENPGSRWITQVEVYLTAHRLVWFLILGGVLERHPDLKVVVTEAGAGAVPYYLRLMDHLAQARNPEALAQILSMKPSEYWERQCYVGASDPAGKFEVDARYLIGVRKLMWGSDYPHLEGTWPKSIERMKEMFEGVPDTEVRQMVGGNAAELYGFDTARLRKIADRIGPAPDAFGEQATSFEFTTPAK